MGSVAGFSYKTSWLAVRNRTPSEVADALELQDRKILDWATGTDRAYQRGVYVATPVPGWTLAHGRLHLPTGFDATEPPFPGWLRQLSRHLGEVQFFANERVPDYHAWARARHGELLRGYCFNGKRGEVPLFVGTPTADEIELGVGLRGMEPGWERWSDDEWTAWYETTPSESDVMAMAGRWSTDPSAIDDATVTEGGIYGLPPSVSDTS
ncbi:hypothetical protein [Micromonospora sediminimaris]|uniref:Uncharacterized protein n=1 Tax=Micromonospora sediminimaris TaxID=547162 RepID=A0A9W5UUV2_9ACTN|nr:hypothetical protein [Micromonospora sediminimaris]GIJ34976.1 hypothetical protein Vse01_41240 [Micromonospora sediminimaris]SFD29164.1 hypothetical protein SAMN05216284_114111 [Micromonospora sediminimaris]